MANWTVCHINLDTESIVVEHVKADTAHAALAAAVAAGKNDPIVFQYWLAPVAQTDSRD